MLTIQINLAKALPDIWAENFDDGEAAVADLKTSERRAGRLAATLQLAVGNDDKVTRDGERFDIWKEISRADLSFLTVDRPPQVGTAYRKVLANANPFEIDAARRNLLLFRELGVLSANVEAALKEMNQAAPDKPAALPVRVILFTSHMLDAPSRDKDKARFPNTPEAVAAARKMIEKVVKEEMNEDGGVSFGLAGGACGSDILFHEVCNALNIPTQLLLALPEAQFQAESVNRGGVDCVAIPATLPTRDASRACRFQGFGALALRQEGLRYLAAE
jgi:hypothetical protein